MCLIQLFLQYMYGIVCGQYKVCKVPNMYFSPAVINQIQVLRYRPLGPANGLKLYKRVACKTLDGNPESIRIVSKNILKMTRDGKYFDITVYHYCSQDVLLQQYYY